MVCCWARSWYTAFRIDGPGRLTLSWNRWPRTLAIYPLFPQKKIEHHHGKWPKRHRCEPCRWHNATGAHRWHRVHRWHKQIEHHHGKWPKNTDTRPVDGATPLAYIDGTMPIQTQLLGVPNFVIDGARPRHTSIKQNAYFSLSLACTYHKIRCRPKCTDHGKPPFSGTTARLSPCAIYSAVSLWTDAKRNTIWSCAIYSKILLDLACFFFLPGVTYRDACQKKNEKSWNLQ